MPPVERRPPCAIIDPIAAIVRAAMLRAAMLRGTSHAVKFVCCRSVWMQYGRCSGWSSRPNVIQRASRHIARQAGKPGHVFEKLKLPHGLEGAGVLQDQGAGFEDHQDYEKAHAQLEAAAPWGMDSELVAQRRPCSLVTARVVKGLLGSWSRPRCWGRVVGVLPPTSILPETTRIPTSASTLHGVERFRPALRLSAGRTVRSQQPHGTVATTRRTQCSSSWERKVGRKTGRKALAAAAPERLVALAVARPRQPASARRLDTPLRFT